MLGGPHFTNNCLRKYVIRVKTKQPYWKQKTLLVLRMTTIFYVFLKQFSLNLIYSIQHLRQYGQMDERFSVQHSHKNWQWKLPKTPHMSTYHHHKIIRILFFMKASKILARFNRSGLQMMYWEWIVQNLKWKARPKVS